MAIVDILLPTRNRLPSLIMTLAGVASQTLHDIHVVLADQSDDAVLDSPVVKTLTRVIEARGGVVELHRRMPRVALPSSAPSFSVAPLLTASSTSTMMY